MDGVIVGLASLLVWVGIGRILLERKSSSLRAKEQAYRFHAMRDELQLLAAERKIDTSSESYGFLISVLNFSIRNAGVVKLREIIEVSERVRRETSGSEFNGIMEDLRRHGPQVQRLAQEFFETFAWMLISNDRLVKYGVAAAGAVKTSLNALQPAIKGANRAVTYSLSFIAPSKVRAVRDARWYSEKARILGTCC